MQKKNGKSFKLSSDQRAMIVYRARHGEMPVALAREFAISKARVSQLMKAAGVATIRGRHYRCPECFQKVNGAGHRCERCGKRLTIDDMIERYRRARHGSLVRNHHTR